MKKLIIVITLFALLALTGAMIWRPKAPLPQPVAINTQNQPTLGKANAKMHIVAFEDLKCVACKEFSNGLFTRIQHDYIDSGIANFTFVNLAFIPGSMPAANAARCLYQQNPQAFFPFIEYIYAHQPPENEDWATLPKLMEFATAASKPEDNIDMQKLAECIYENRYNHFIEHNFKVAKTAIGPKVITPSIFINNIKVEPLTYERIQTIINR